MPGSPDDAPSAFAPAGLASRAGQPVRFLDDIVRVAASRAPDEIAVVCGSHRPTFAALDARVTRLRNALATCTAPGDRVVVISRNRVEMVECYYAVPGAGRLLAPLNRRLHPREWDSAIAHLAPRAILGERDLLELLDAKTQASVPHVVAFGPFDDGERAGASAVSEPGGTRRRATEPGFDDYDAFLDVAPAGSRRRELARVDSDPAWLLGTSGTTGVPKFAILSHRSLLAAVRTTRAARGLADDDVLLTPFPLCHVAGYNVLLFHSGARTVVVMRAFDPVAIAHAAREHRVTTLSLAPTMVGMLLDDSRVDRAELETVRTITYGSSPMPDGLVRRTIAELGHGLAQGYGMTELSGNAVFLGPDDHRRAVSGEPSLLGAAGRPGPGVEVRIDGDGEHAAVGELGEIAVRGEQVMSGYWDDPDRTADALRDGWLLTGDVGYIDESGYLHVVDRKKDVIVSGGENVASREVEDVLRAHPGVADVAVVGTPDDRWGERVCAVVVRDSSGGAGAVEADELMTFCRSRLGGYKVPRRIEFVESLPRNATGKVLKDVLRNGLLAPSPTEDNP